MPQTARHARQGNADRRMRRIWKGRACSPVWPRRLAGYVRPGGAHRPLCLVAGLACGEVDARIAATDAPGPARAGGALAVSGPSTLQLLDGAGGSHAPALRAANLDTLGNETPACSLLVSMEPKASGRPRRPVR